MQVVETFQGHFNVPLVHVEAEDSSSTGSRGRGPEEKRKRVGEEFIRVFEDEALRQGGSAISSRARSIRT